MDMTRFQNAIALRGAGRIEDAIREFRMMAEGAHDANEKAGIMINEVRSYCDLGRLQDAKRVLRQIRAFAPNDPIVRVNVDFGAACLAAQEGDPKEAATLFEAILEEHPQILEAPEYVDLYEDIQQRLAIAMTHLKRYAEALPILVKAQSFETLSPQDKQEGHLYLGICYQQLGDDAGAKAQFQGVISFGLNNGIEASARYRLGILYFSAGAFAQARQQLETILQTYEEDLPSLPLSHIYNQLSSTYHQLGDEENAKRYEKKAHESA